MNSLEETCDSPLAAALLRVRRERDDLRMSLVLLLDWAEHIEGEGRLRRTEALQQARDALKAAFA